VIDIACGAGSLAERFAGIIFVHLKLGKIAFSIVIHIGEAAW